jgi:hypothetical protein
MVYFTPSLLAGRVGVGSVCDVELWQWSEWYLLLLLEKRADIGITSVYRSEF